MNMKGLAAAIFAAFAACQVSAQGAGTEDDGGLNMGETIVDGRTVGEEFIKEEFGDWSHRCVMNADGTEICNSYQLLLDQDGNRVAEISLFPLANAGEAAAGGTIVTPLETLLTRQITIQIDGGAARRYPFTFCSAGGCVARVGFTQADVDAFKRGAEATMTIVPFASPDRPVALSVSLTGFTAAYDGLDAL